MGELPEPAALDRHADPARPSTRRAPPHRTNHAGTHRPTHPQPTSRDHTDRDPRRDPAEAAEDPDPPPEANLPF
jgi:hypothetical protein